jgi:hypothetical protein
VTTVSITIPLAHQGFGAIVLAFHKAVTQARWQTVKESENFMPPIVEGKALRNSFGPLRLTSVIQASNPAAAVALKLSHTMSARLP